VVSYLQVGESKQTAYLITREREKERKMDTLFKGKCDTCEREYLPTNMSMCNQCATEEESNV